LDALRRAYIGFPFECLLLGSRSEEEKLQVSHRHPVEHQAAVIFRYRFWKRVARKGDDVAFIHNRRDRPRCATVEEQQGERRDHDRSAGRSDIP